VTVIEGIFISLTASLPKAALTGFEVAVFDVGRRRIQASNSVPV
jgi:hypothetical protein